MMPIFMWILQALAAVDDEFRAGDERGLLGDQERHGVGDLRRLADPAERRRGGQPRWVGSSSMGVAIGPGNTALTRMPAGASSAAAAWVSPRSAHFDEP